MSEYRRLDVSEVGDVTVIRFRDHKIVGDINIQELAQEMFQLIEKVRRETVYAGEASKHALLERLQKSKERSQDAWLEGDSPRHPTQFVQIKALEEELV